MITKDKIQLMGTTIEMGVNHPEGLAILEAAKKKLIDYEARFSANRPDSMLSKINQAAGKAFVSVDHDLFTLIAIGKKASLVPHSAFNIAIGPLTKLWHIGFKDAKKPSDKEIQQVLPLINANHILLDERHSAIYLKQQGMSIDLGGIAKGYFADLIMQDFKQQGVMSAYINLGGNVLVSGPNYEQEDFKWQIGLQNPFLERGNQVLTLKLTDYSVVTSGIYERVNTFEGQKYHHIFDSKTGYPLESEIASLTILSKKSVDGEIYTSSLFSYSPIEAVKYIMQQTLHEIIVITKNGEMIYSPGIKDLLA